MSEENVRRAERAYAAINEAYRTGDLGPVIEEYLDPEVVMQPAGVMPEGPSEVRGRAAVLAYLQGQLEAFADLSIEPERFIAGDDLVVVPIRLGGQARFTQLPVELSFAQVGHFRDGMIVRIDVYATLDQALEATGLSDSGQ
jgi:ketosteroid isomerase-like protein